MRRRDFPGAATEQALRYCAWAKKQLRHPLRGEEGKNGNGADQAAHFNDTTARTETRAHGCDTERDGRPARQRAVENEKRRGATYWPYSRSTSRRGSSAPCEILNAFSNATITFGAAG